MIRITVSEEPMATGLIVEGKLTSPWIGELERCWNETRSLNPHQDIRVDLSGVTFVDDDGKQLLALMHESGVEGDRVDDRSDHRGDLERNAGLMIRMDSLAFIDRSQEQIMFNRSIQIIIVMCALTMTAGQASAQTTAR
jgi:hypothetical protein